MEGEAQGELYPDGPQAAGRHPTEELRVKRVGRICLGLNMYMQRYTGVKSWLSAWSCSTLLSQSVSTFLEAIEAVMGVANAKEVKAAEERK